MMKYLLPIVVLSCLGHAYGQKTQDFFKVHRGELPVKVHYESRYKPMSLLGIDGSRGIIYAKIQGAGQVQLELRGLKKQNIKRFEFEWPRDVAKTIKLLSDEQYDPQLLPLLRPTIYKLLLYLEIPQEFFPIHDACLVYVQALVAMEQFDEAFYVLSRLKLNLLDEFGYREFSEAALDLAGKMIATDPKSAKMARALLQKVTIRDNSGDHAAYLKLANSLREQGLYTDAISEYARLAPIVMKSPGSPYKEILRIWPVYCYVKLYEQYSKAAAKDKRYLEYANKYFNTALQTVKKLDTTPPPRQTGEYSLYKLVRSLIRVQYARRYEAQGSQAQAAEYYRQSVLEVTEGIISARVGLAWLPESLMMAGAAYEKLELFDAARNVYKQVSMFFTSTKWETMSKGRLAGLPPPSIEGDEDLPAP
jgi:tetratricopeptide (TPR) repeat protein